jgi:hypothetical protein
VIFHDVTIVGGSVYSRRTHDTTALTPAAVAVFRGMLEHHGAVFLAPLPVRGLERIELAWTRPGCAALATFWDGEGPVTISALAPGRDPADDEQVLAALQDLVVRFFGDSPVEPGFELLSLAERPLLATMPIPRPAVAKDLGLIADAETCLAAAFFQEVLGPESAPAAGGDGP